MPPANFADAATAWGSDFRAGKIAFFPSNYASAVLSADAPMRARTGVSLLPGPDGGTAFFDGGDNLCIPRGAKNASGAWQFAKFALDIPQQQLLPEGGYTPVRGDAASGAFGQKYPLDLAPLDHLDRGYAPITLAYNLLYNQPDSPFIGDVPPRGVRRRRRRGAPGGTADLRPDPAAGAAVTGTSCAALHQTR